MKGDLRYTPSDVYETFPKPAIPVPEMEEVEGKLDEERSEIMLRRNLGLTKLYNLVHDSGVQGDGDIDRLREIHVEVDETVKEAYGWFDLDLQHGHYETDQGMRWTVAPAVRVEILDRLLELNFERHQKEVEDGVWPPKKSSKKEAAAKKKSKVSAEQNALFWG